MRPRHPPRGLPRVRGAATLVTVMVLFLVMALLGVYANRSLVIEQRLSAGHVRAGIAQELAEGGIDWAVAMLNGPATDTRCAAVHAGGTRFIDRYLAVSPADRATREHSDALAGEMPVDCVSTPAGLQCRCFDPGRRGLPASADAPASAGASVSLQLGTDRAVGYGSFNVSAVGCAGGDAERCSEAAGRRSHSATAAVRQQAAVGFIGAVPSSPGSPLTVKGRLKTIGDGGLGLHNSDGSTAGRLLVSGGPATPLLASRMDTLPGTPPAQAWFFDDASLARQNPTEFFQTFLGMAPSRYARHPALHGVACPAAGDCGPALVSAHDAGWRILWVEGPLQVDGPVTLGGPDAPVLLVVNGDVTLRGPLALTGMLFARGHMAWTHTAGGTSRIMGMLVVQGDLTTTGRMDIVYQQAVADQLRNRIGSYVRVSGGLRDGTVD